MGNQSRKMKSTGLEARVIISDIRSDIELEGFELLKLNPGQPGAGVRCTAGALWLTQAGDPCDHILIAGQSFSLTQPGIVLVQGLPCGKVLIMEMAQEPAYNKRNCSGQWDTPLEAE